MAFPRRESWPGCLSPPHLGIRRVGGIPLGLLAEAEDRPQRLPPRRLGRASRREPLRLHHRWPKSLQLPPSVGHPADPAGGQALRHGWAAHLSLRSECGPLVRPRCARRSLVHAPAGRRPGAGAPRRDGGVATTWLPALVAIACDSVAGLLAGHRPSFSVGAG